MTNSQSYQTGLAVDRFSLKVTARHGRAIAGGASKSNCEPQIDDRQQLNGCDRRRHGRRCVG